MFILFLFVSWHEQAIHGKRGSAINRIPVRQMGSLSLRNPKNMARVRNKLRHILQEPDKPGRNLLGLTSQPLPQRLHRRRRLPLRRLQGARRLRPRNHHLPRLLPARVLHARRKMLPPAPPRHPGASQLAQKKGPAVGAPRDALSFGGQMEEGPLFFELSPTDLSILQFYSIHLP